MRIVASKKRGRMRQKQSVEGDEVKTSGGSDGIAEIYLTSGGCG